VARSSNPILHSITHDLQLSDEQKLQVFNQRAYPGLRSYGSEWALSGHREAFFALNSEGSLG
jgi:hypothetical protein